ncbi:MAG: PilZ domain-containing protein [Myxococcota bacterium]
MTYPLERKEPRFNSSSSVLVQLDGRAELEELWTANISRGGLFVVTRDPPPRGTRVKVLLETPVGSLELLAEVAHTVSADAAAQAWQAPGAGLRFLEVTAEQRLTIERYLEDLPSLQGGGVRAGVDLQHVLEEARTVMKGVDAGDLYAALQLAPNADKEQVRARMRDLVALFTTPPPQASPAQATRIQTALRGLQRLLLTLTATISRIEAQAARTSGATFALRGTEYGGVRRPIPATGEAPRGTLAEARMHAERARLLLEKMSFAEAEQEFEQACAKDSVVVDYQVGLAWAIAQNPARPAKARLERALEMLRGVTARERNAEALYTTGMVLDLMGRDDEAVATMKQVLSVDKDHLPAQRMVRLLEMRRNEGNGSGLLGLFSKLTRR